MHTPVLLQAVIDALEVEDHGLYIDATAGEGGHTAAILDRGGYVLAIDWDDKQLDRLRVKMHNEHLRYGHGNYADIAHIARSQNFAPVNGVVFDFGLSMYQLSDGGRGFSYKKPSDPLDMRIDIQEDLHAEEILNTWDEADLEDIFSKCGEILGSDKLAHAIVRR
jgi:16S rRNA (cytosine1402-N4)-methyltransferase